MIKVKNIKKYASIIILCSFILHSIPKVVLHNVFANHHHITHSKKASNSNATNFDVKSNCDCNDLYTVAFFDDYSFTVILNKQYFKQNYSSLITNTIPTKYNSILLRGPPTA